MGLFNLHAHVSQFLIIRIYIYTPLVLSLPRTQNTLEPESLRSNLDSTTAQPYKLKQIA